MSPAAPRAAIYARYSTDLQNERSIADQLALCRSLAERAGYEIVATYEDRATSGASTARRSGFRALMAAAANRQFDVLLAEDVDRIARDQADYHAARKQLDFLDITIHTASGVIGRLEGSMRALMSEMFLDNLVTHIRRGMGGVVRSGRSAGGKAYGYRPVPGKPGELEINHDEAEVIRGIFAAAIAGETPATIAAALNREGITPPRGGYWRSNTLLGHAGRACGILRNEIYTGQMTWNRVHMVRNPASGKRVSRPNPQSEWQRVAVPHLRIIDDISFRRVEKMIAARCSVPIDHHRKHQPRRMLSGLLRCGACGAGMSIKDRANGHVRIVCSAMHQGSACDNRRPYFLEEIERTVLEGLRETVGSRAAIALFITTYNDERQRAAAGKIRARNKLESRKAEVDREIKRTVAALVKGTLSEPEAAEHLPPLRAEKAAIEAELAAAPEAPKVLGLHPTAVQTYLRDLERLGELIHDDMDAGGSEVAAIIRDLVDTVTVMPAPAGKRPEVRVQGHLARLVDLVPSSSRQGETLVAGDRFAGLPRPAFGFRRRAN